MTFQTVISAHFDVKLSGGNLQLVDISFKAAQIRNCDNLLSVCAEIGRFDSFFSFGDTTSSILEDPFRFGISPNGHF